MPEEQASYCTSEMLTLAERTIYFWKGIAGDRVHGAHIAAHTMKYPDNLTTHGTSEVSELENRRQ